MNSTSLPIRLAVEFLGSLFLFSIIISTGSWIAIGGALALAVFFGGKISGGHFNPAVSAMFFMRDSLSAVDTLMYMVTQVTAGITAYYLNDLLVVAKIASNA